MELSVRTSMLDTRLIGELSRPYFIMTNKEINREAGRLFESLLIPSWAIRSQEDQEDYGVDAELEVTDPQDKATGLIFKVQLKGTETAQYDDHGNLVYSKGAVARFNYYVSNLKIPIVFVVCDIESRNCFWIRVQGNRTLESDLKQANDHHQQSFTVRMPRENTVEKTRHSTNRILEEVSNASDTIALRQIKSISTDEFQRYVEFDGGAETTEKQFKFFAGVAADKVIQDLIIKGKLEEACYKARSILGSSTDAPEIRIRAGIHLAFAFHKIAVRDNLTNSHMEAAKQRSAVASAILKIAKNRECSSGLRRYVQVYARAARVGLRGLILEAIALSEKIQNYQNENLLDPIIQIQRISLFNAVTRDFNRIYDLIKLTVDDGYYEIVPYMIKEILDGMLNTMHAFRLLEKHELTELYTECICSWVNSAITILHNHQNDEDPHAVIKSLAIGLMCLADYKKEGDAEHLYTKIISMLDRDPPFLCFAEIKGLLADVKEKHARSAKADKKLSYNELIPLYERHAAALGINLDDPDDDIAEVVRIGLKDLDPTRVARSCSHIHLKYGSSGIPAKMLGLPSAGSKKIICLKHGHSMQGLKLDELFGFFSKKFPWDNNEIRCECCPDKAPLPDEWKWTDEWAQAQNIRYEDMKAAFNGGKKDEL